VDTRDAPRKRLVRSTLLAVVATGLALVGSGVHGITSMDGSLARAVVQKNAREAQQLLEHREAEQRAVRREEKDVIRFRELTGPPPSDCPQKKRVKF
jgi:hypothetical protein